MKRIVLLLLLPLVAACQGSDGHEFERKEFERFEPTITIITHPTLEDLRAKAPAAAQQGEARKLMAWSIVRPGGCEVHIVDPLEEWRPEWIGHEVAHCAWGRWHR